MKRRSIRGAMTLIPVTLCFLALLTGCRGEGIQAVQDLVPLQKQLAAEYRGANIEVEIEGGTTSGLLNSTLTGPALLSGGV